MPSRLSLVRSICSPTLSITSSSSHDANPGEIPEHHTHLLLHRHALTHNQHTPYEGQVWHAQLAAYTNVEHQPVLLLSPDAFGTTYKVDPSFFVTGNHVIAETAVAVWEKYTDALMAEGRKVWIVVEVVGEIEVLVVAVSGSA